MHTFYYRIRLVHGGGSLVQQRLHHFKIKLALLPQCLLQKHCIPVLFDHDVRVALDHDHGVRGDPSLRLRGLRPHKTAVTTALLSHFPRIPWHKMKVFSFLG